VTPPPAAPALRVEYLRVRDIPPAVLNPKRHQGKGIEASIGRFGFVEPMVLDGRTGRLVAGHGRREALLALEGRGGAAPGGIEARADGWYAPVLVGWCSSSDEEAQAFLLAANQLTEAGGWDPVELGRAIESVRASVDLRHLGFTKRDLEKAIAAARTSAEKIAGVVHADGPERPEVPTSRLGDLYRMGEHRLLVGDSTNPADVLRLMDGKRAACVVTDPPYAIYGSSSGLSSSVADDKMVRPFFRDVLAAAQASTRTFGHVYVFCDWRSWASWWEVAKLTSLVPKNLIAWDKGCGLGSMYANHHELIGFLANDPPQVNMWTGKESGTRVVLQPNVIRLGNVSSGKREHNAQKPVELVEVLLKNSTDPGDLVLDLFAGSGTTLVACEAQGRTCYTMEIDPANADVSVARWARATGKTPELVRE